MGPCVRRDDGHSDVTQNPDPDARVRAWLGQRATIGEAKSETSRFARHFQTRHCEERTRRRNPCFPRGGMDCFASLAMTGLEARREGERVFRRHCEER